MYLYNETFPDSSFKKFFKHRLSEPTDQFFIVIALHQHKLSYKGREILIWEHALIPSKTQVFGILVFANVKDAFCTCIMRAWFQLQKVFQTQALRTYWPVFIVRTSSAKLSYKIPQGANMRALFAPASSSLKLEVSKAIEQRVFKV